MDSFVPPPASPLRPKKPEPGLLGRLFGRARAAPEAAAPLIPPEPQAGPEAGFQGPMRYVPRSGARYQELVEAAETYTYKLTPQHRAGLLLKPLDAGDQHRHYLRATYSILNAIQRLGLPAGSTVVDAGAGPGWLSEHLLLLGYRVILLEPSQDMLDVARTRIERAAAKWEIDLLARAEFTKATIENLPEHLQGSSRAQAVIFYEAWHHVIDEHRAAQNLFGLLAPGGRIAVLTEGRWMPGERALEDLLDEEMATYGTLESPFTREYMTHVLGEAGFSDIEFLHAVNGFFPASEGRRTIEEAAGEGHERGWNNCIALRPRERRPDELDYAATRSRLTLAGLTLLEGGRIRVSVRAENLGTSTWRAAAGRCEGLVTLGMVGTLGSGAGEAELIGRGEMERDVAPGESLVVSGEFLLRELRAPFHASLVAEGSFWFAERLPVEAGAG